MDGMAVLKMGCFCVGEGAEKQIDVKLGDGELRIVTRGWKRRMW